METTKRGLRQTRSGSTTLKNLSATASTKRDRAVLPTVRVPVPEYAETLQLAEGAECQRGLNQRETCLDLAGPANY
jgi:hypothetical protein